MSARGINAAKKGAPSASTSQGDEVATYALDMLQSLRDTCSDDKHRFLSYLIGMAAEEAQRLSEGLPSAGGQAEPSKIGRGQLKKH